MTETETETGAQPPESRFAKAGRVGATRIRQLRQLGLQYERELGLSPKRSRHRQLVELGHRFEQEHGLAPKVRVKRKSSDELWEDFLRALSKVVKSGHRRKIERLVGELASSGREAHHVTLGGTTDGQES